MPAEQPLSSRVTFVMNFFDEVRLESTGRPINVTRSVNSPQPIPVPVVKDCTDWCILSPNAVSASFATLRPGAWNWSTLQSARGARQHRFCHSGHSLRIDSFSRTVVEISHGGCAAEGRWQGGHVGA